MTIRVIPVILSPFPYTIVGRMWQLAQLLQTFYADYGEDHRTEQNYPFCFHGLGCNNLTVPLGYLLSGASAVSDPEP